MGQNTLHGGFKGWNSKIWNAAIQCNQPVLSLLSEDGDEGFPGDAIASVIFHLTTDGELRIEMKVFVTKATPINLTNHSYFNLAGHVRKPIFRNLSSSLSLATFAHKMRN